VVINDYFLGENSLLGHQKERLQQLQTIYLEKIHQFHHISMQKPINSPYLHIVVI
jgi:hypothetical protein